MAFRWWRRGGGFLEVIQPTAKASKAAHATYTSGNLRRASATDIRAKAKRLGTSLHKRSQPPPNRQSPSAGARLKAVRPSAHSVVVSVEARAHLWSAYVTASHLESARQRAQQSAARSCFSIWITSTTSATHAFLR